ncbi:MAG: outer membrane beta-barrel protein [Gammaproteobacteria bacterium]|nr:outer membrane beta-barrel protein [Gammaproteobacteria bacterium]
MKRATYKKIIVWGGISTLLGTLSSAYAGDDTFYYPLGFGVTASPSIDVSTRHDDNIWLQDNNNVESSWITEIAPSVTLMANDGPNQYSAQYTMKAGRYHSSRNDDYVDHLFNMNSHNEFNYRNQLNLEFDYLHLHEQRGTGLSDHTGYVRNSPDEYNDMLIGGNYIYGGGESAGRIKVEASHFERDYSNHRDYTRYFDRDEDKIGSTFYYRIMPKTSLLFEAEYKDINYDNSPTYVDKVDGDEQTYQVGVTWEATAKTTGTAQIGQTYKNFDKSAYKDKNFTSWALILGWAPLSYSLIDVSSSRYPVETNGNGSFIENTEYMAAWSHAWTDKVHSRVSSRFVKQDYQDSHRDDDIVDFGVGADYNFRRGIQFSVDYDYSNRDSNQRNSDYNDNVFMLSVKMGI